MYVGKLLEFRLLQTGERAALIKCDKKIIPSPGQYLLAHDPDDQDNPLADVLFASGYTEHGFIAAAPIPANWKIGTELQLWGPHGKGFRMPSMRNLALLAINKTVTRLSPLVELALKQRSAVTLFTSHPVDLPLPPAVEIQPLPEVSGQELDNASRQSPYEIKTDLRWAEFIAIDIPYLKLPNLRAYLGLENDERIHCPVQILIDIPMPCGGIADCGVCALPSSKSGYKLACKDGPVFNINDLRRVR